MRGKLTLCRARSALLLWLAATAAGLVAAVPPTAPRVLIAEVDDAIHPISAEFMVSTMDRADTSQAAALIFVLRTPGGVLDSTRTIISRMIAARTPIVVYVGPSGARAASAGFLITLAADVAVMAPGTHIGAAHPINVGASGNNDKTMADKAASDVAAYARSLAQGRERNAALAEEAVLKSRSFTEREATTASPPIVDFIATSLDDVIAKLDGRTVRRFNGSTVSVRTKDATREQAQMTWRQRFLSTLASPQIAFLLFTLGMLGLTVELWNPGSVLPGVVGALCLLLAFLAFQVLPINVTGLLLIMLGIGLLVLELKLPSFGALGIGGVVSLILGSIVMMGDTPELRVGLRLIVPAMLAFGGIFLFLGRLALTSQRRPAVSGAAGMVGIEGTALSALGPQQEGRVAVRGEIWSAIAAEQPITAGERVRVRTLKGLTLIVEPVTTPKEAPLA
jgi:membrane-bound serine protease (ClpP class)